tara:strand:- start:9736 stop:11670 length:1935 start_codon:yes stop_codon:yes gene_type:complete
MGVPGFFLWLSKKAKLLKLKEQLILKRIIDPEKVGDSLDCNAINSEKLDNLNYSKDIDWFLIDTNCLIHPVCFKVLAETDEDISNSRLEDKMMIAVIDYIEWLIDFVSPTKGVYLAIDGVAPAAKMKQQRYRRFTSVYMKNLEMNIRKKHGKEQKRFWNNSAVTPGTEFMERLHHKLMNWLKNKERGIKIIYSSCKTPSEGEHKLLQFIRDNKKDNKIYKYVVYGLDADLIFLSLASNNPNVYLLREAQELDKKNCANELNYVSIDFMKQFIFDIVKSIISHKNIDLRISDGDDEEEEDEGSKSEHNEINLTDDKIDNVIKDFIFICYLLGNDFVPHLESINIYDGGIDFLLEQYSELLISNGFSSFIVKQTGHEIITHTINQRMFTELISLIASEESENLKNAYVSKRRKHRCPSSDPFEQEMFKIENLDFKIEDPIMLGSDESELWKKRYYLHYYKKLVDSDEETYNNHVSSMVEEYIKGLKWITRYYFDGCPSWNWFYRFDYPPFLEDIRDFLITKKDFSIKNLKFKISRPLRPFNQLLLVLPPQSSFLVPKMLRPLMNDPESKLVKKGVYPTRFEIDYINKHKQWMGIPQLPEIDIDIVYDSYSKVEKEMMELKDKQTKIGNEVKSVLYRNKIYTNFEFN